MDNDNPQFIQDASIFSLQNLCSTWREGTFRGTACDLAKPGTLAAQLRRHLKKLAASWNAARGGQHWGVSPNWSGYDRPLDADGFFVVVPTFGQTRRLSYISKIITSMIFPWMVVLYNLYNFHHDICKLCCHIYLPWEPRYGFILEDTGEERGNPHNQRRNYC